MTKFDQFLMTYPDHHRKIHNDPELQSSDKATSFDNHLRSCTCRYSLEECANKFFNEHKLLGKTINSTIKKNEIFGRVHNKHAFIFLIQKELKGTGLLVRNWLHDIKSEPTPERRLKRIKLLLDSIPINRNLIWGFRNEITPSTPLEGVVNPSLPCRLGLPPKEKEYFVFGIDIPSAHEIKQPTAFDPGMEHLARWEPGGKSIPTDACKVDYPEGFPEIVFGPLNFSQIASDFLEITIP